MKKVCWFIFWLVGHVCKVAGGAKSCLDVHWLSQIFIDFHWFSSIFLDLAQFSQMFIDFLESLLIFFDFRILFFISFGFSLFSWDVLSIFSFFGFVSMIEDSSWLFKDVLSIHESIFVVLIDSYHFSIFVDFHNYDIFVEGFCFFVDVFWMSSILVYLRFLSILFQIALMSLIRFSKIFLSVHRCSLVLFVCQDFLKLLLLY